MDVTTFLLNYDDGALRITSLTGVPGVRVEGQLDYRGVITVMGALTATRKDDKPPSLDLSGLWFIDVQSLRTLEIASQRGLVNITAVSPWLGRLLERTHWDGMLGRYAVEGQRRAVRSRTQCERLSPL
ncbi:hypothetical protein [Sphaerisporangium aureirubrum]|uniref:STAS domain-containing protein n=1 Tax=Sphaerisporangium aureirubrum TaxID=1544736 RepID=A0ABW1NLV8_9ACTN